MITKEGYSKDPNIQPEGIAITWSKEMIEEGYGTLRLFIDHFLETMADDEGIWCQKCKNRPRFEIIYVYIIFKNRLRYRCNFVNYEVGETTLYDANGPKKVKWNRIQMTGPLVRCPIKRTLKGFQGFRYTTKLF